MQPLHVSIHDPRTGQDADAAFHASPVRIGRSSLNDLVLDEPSVSQWHAQLTFDADHVWFTDVGSSNGSLIDGLPVVSGHAIPIVETTTLEVGPLLLRLKRVDRATPARRPPMLGDDQLTTMLSELDVAGPIEDDAATEHHDEEPATEVAGSAVRQLHFLRSVLGAVAAARGEYFGVVRDQVEALPAEARAQILQQLAREHPDLVRAPEFEHIAVEHGAEGLRADDVAPLAWLARLVGRPVSGPRGEEVSDARALARVAALLRSFAQSLVELQRAREQLARELGLGAGEDLPRSSEDLLAFLLDFGVDGEARTASVQRTFAEIAMHPVALVGATRDGVRAMVAEIEPTALAARSRRGLVAELQTIAGHPGWDAYRRVHADLSEGDRCVQRVFGARFSRSYLTAMGRARPTEDDVPASTATACADVPPTRIR